MAAGDEALLRVVCAPGVDGEELLDRLEELAARLSVELRVSARALSGVLLVRLRGPLDGQRRIWAQLDGPGRHVHLLAGPAGLRASTPAWGRPPGAIGLMRALKAAIDPHKCLSPGRFVV